MSTVREQAVGRMTQDLPQGSKGRISPGIDPTSEPLTAESGDDRNSPGEVTEQTSDLAPDPIREQIARDLDANVMLQFAFSKATRLSRAGQLEDAAAEYAKIAGATSKPGIRGFALLLQAEMLLRDPGTVLDTASARAALEKAQNLDPPIREWTFTLGMLALREGRLDDARPLFVRSFTSDHQPQEAAAYLAIVDAGLGDPEAGRQWLELARENGAAWRSPEAEIALRNPEDPVAALVAAAAEHPEEFWLRLALARELTAAQRRDELVEVTRELAADVSVPERFRAVAALGAARTLLLYEGDERVGEAMKLAAQARTLAPKALGVWEVLGLGWCRQGHFRRAAGAARRVIKADSEAVTAYYVRAWALACSRRGGQKKSAESALAAGLSRDPNSPLRRRAEDAVAACR
jgi:tetratricopeptide (TPR) repeat protein